MSDNFVHFKNRATTLDFTIIPEDEPANSGSTGDYFRLTYGKGDKTIRRTDLVCGKKYPKCASNECGCKTVKSDKANKKIECAGCKNKKCICKKKPLHMATFVQISDVHIIDFSSPARSSFLAQYIPEEPVLSDSFRPYEAFSTQVAECMVRKINAVEKGPILGQPFSFVISTGDSGDGMQKNEITNFINLLDGTIVTPIPTRKYVGVQDDYPAYNYVSYYHPNEHPPGVPNDNYKTQFGYPNFQDILISAAKSFCATGLKVPYYSTMGNHDSALLGNYSLGLYTMLTLLDQIATGRIPDLGSKLVESMSPILAQMFAKALQMQDAQGVLDVLNASQLREVPRSNKRLHYMRADFINAHFQTTICPGPVGHGFNSYNIENNVAYYTFKVAENITGIVLDSCNLNGNLLDLNEAPNGGIGRNQLNWFERELQKRHSSYYNTQNELICTDNKDELILVFQHHTIDTLTNNFTSPTTFDNDPQRILGPEFVQVLHRYPNVIALINGHLHRNRILPFPCCKTGFGFFEVNTCAHIDYPQQSRIIEIADNQDGTLSIFCTMINHQSPIQTDKGCFSTGPARNCCSRSFHTSENSESKCCTSENREKETYTIPEMASISRELSYNDPYIVDEFDSGENRTGDKRDRNVELVLFNPLLRCKPKSKQ